MLKDGWLVGLMTVSLTFIQFPNLTKLFKIHNITPSLHLTQPCCLEWECYFTNNLIIALSKIVPVDPGGFIMCLAWIASKIHRTNDIIRYTECSTE